MWTSKTLLLHFVPYLCGVRPAFLQELHFSQPLPGKFNSKQRSWLVIWEAGVVIELPAGVFLLYPSALFFHFNVDINKITGGRLASPFLASADALLQTS
jgi:hypothetical protein